MKPNELRLGNLLSFKDNCCEETVSVTELNLNSILTGGDQMNQIGLSPAPLTKEWLEKLGFVEKSLGMNKIAWEKNRVVIQQFSNDFRAIISEDWLVPVNYVHQLQNLYFALTGEELVSA